jgi:hypothetical protein
MKKELKDLPELWRKYKELIHSELYQMNRELTDTHFPGEYNESDYREPSIAEYNLEAQIDELMREIERSLL